MKILLRAQPLRSETKVSKPSSRSSMAQATRTYSSPQGVRLTGCVPRSNSGSPMRCSRRRMQALREGWET